MTSKKRKRARRTGKISNEILNYFAERAKGRCEKCNKDLSDVVVHFHHINGNSGNNKIENLIALCLECHEQAHNRKITEKDMLEEGVGVFSPVY